MSDLTIELTGKAKEDYIRARFPKNAPKQPAKKAHTMSTRITEKDLQNILDRINDATGQITEGYPRQDDGTLKCNVGTYVLDWAYGGVRLSQLMNESGGERDITGRGTKRETYGNMRAFLAGVEVNPNG